jgi:hypothetical protein
MYTHLILGRLRLMLFSLQRLPQSVRRVAGGVGLLPAARVITWSEDRWRMAGPLT